MRKVVGECIRASRRVPSLQLPLRLLLRRYPLRLRALGLLKGTACLSELRFGRGFRRFRRSSRPWTDSQDATSGTREEPPAPRGVGEVPLRAFWTEA